MRIYDAAITDDLDGLIDIAHDQANRERGDWTFSGSKGVAHNNDIDQGFEGDDIAGHVEASAGIVVPIAVFLGNGVLLLGEWRFIRS